MKKVGIVTWYWGNYGSILQAYALQQAIIELGLPCEVINHRVNGNAKEQILYRIKHNGILHTAGYYMRKISARMERSSVEELFCRNKAFEKLKIIFSYLLYFIQIKVIMNVNNMMFMFVAAIRFGIQILRFYCHSIGLNLLKEK